MRWWLRLLVTLILPPLLWRLAVAYVTSQQGTRWIDLAQQSLPLLGSVYLTFTLPALAVCGVLTIGDFILAKLGLDLTTVAVSPILAGLIAIAVVRFVHDPHVQAVDGAVVLAIVYGLVWGLTIREPRVIQAKADAARP